MKIIHILCHTIPLKKDYIFHGFTARTARVIRQYSPIDQHECWFAVRDINQPKVWFKDKIKFRAFPAWTLSVYLESFLGVVIAKSLIQALRKEIKNEKIIIHIQGERGLLVWQIINVAKGRPIFIQFHGYSTPYFMLPFEQLLIMPFERYFFSFVNNFFVCFKHRVKYLVEKCQIPATKIYNQNVGVNYDLFKPVNKRQVKKKLGLPLDKNIILYVGLLNRNKGVKKIVGAHLKIKEKCNTFLLLIGGSRKDKYYDFCMKGADLMIGRLSHTALPEYFNAADVYCLMAPKNKAKYGGLGVAPMEALACNVPVLCSTLHDAPDEIISQIGFVVNSESELADKMTFIFQNKDKFSQVRQITRPYFSWKVVVEKIINSYRKAEKALAKN